MTINAADKRFLELKEEFLDLYAALEITRRTAEAAGRIAPADSPVTKAHDALRGKLLFSQQSEESEEAARQEFCAKLDSLTVYDR